MNTTWTAADDATLVKMIGEGVSASIVAKRLGRSRSAVCGRAYRKHLQFDSHIRQPTSLMQPAKAKERFTAAEDKVIIEMAAAGKSGLDIGRALNRHKSSVVKRARLLGAALKGKDGPKPGTKPKAPAVKASKVKLHPGNIAGKKESRTHDPEFKHVTPAVAVVPLMISVMDIKDSQCRFPIGDPREESFGYCGHPRAQQSYCLAHARLAYQSREDRRRAA